MARVFTSAQPHLLQLLGARPLPLGFASPAVPAAGLSRETTQEGSVWPGSLCISPVFWYFLARLSVACYIYQRVFIILDHAAV